nr:hypothetical protein Iba_chr14eCG3000 [Ipomoea batatas]
MHWMTSFFEKDSPRIGSSIPKGDVSALPNIELSEKRNIQKSYQTTAVFPLGQILSMYLLAFLTHAAQSSVETSPRHMNRPYAVSPEFSRPPAGSISCGVGTGNRGSFAQACLTIPVSNIRPTLRQTVDTLRFSEVPFLSRKLPVGRLIVDHSSGHLSQRLVHGHHETIRLRIVFSSIRIERDERRIGYPIYSVAYTRAAVGGDFTPAHEKAIHGGVAVPDGHGGVVKAIFAVAIGRKGGEENIEVGSVIAARSISRGVGTELSETLGGNSGEQSEQEEDAEGDSPRTGSTIPKGVPSLQCFQAYNIYHLRLHEPIRLRIVQSVTQNKNDRRLVGPPIYRAVGVAQHTVIVPNSCSHLVGALLQYRHGGIAYTRAANGGGDISSAHEQAVHGGVAPPDGGVVKAVCAVGVGRKGGEENIEVCSISAVRSISSSRGVGT